MLQPQAQQQHGMPGMLSQTQAMLGGPQQAQQQQQGMPGLLLPQTQAMLGVQPQAQTQPQLLPTDMMLTTQAMAQPIMTSSAAYTVLQQQPGQAVQQQGGPRTVLLQSGSPGTASSVGDCPVAGMSNGSLASLQQQQQQHGQWAAVGANWQPVMWT